MGPILASVALQSTKLRGISAKKKAGATQPIPPIGDKVDDIRPWRYDEDDAVASTVWAGVVRGGSAMLGFSCC